MNKRNGDRSFTDGRRHALDVPAPDVAHGELDDWLSAEQELTQEDEALARPCRTVHLAEPTVEETRRVLYQGRPRLERDYSVALPDESLETALRLW